MAMRKNTKGKGRRRGGNRRRGYGRKARAGINPSYHAPKNFCETIYYKDITSAASSSTTTGTAFQMSLLPNTMPLFNGQLRDAFRQFCIRGVKIIYKPSFNVYAQTTGVAIAPRLYWAEDKTAVVTDNSSFNLTRLLTQDNVKEFNPTRQWSQYVRFPKPVLLQNTDDVVPGGTLLPTVVQTPANRPLWLSTSTQTEFLDEPGAIIPHILGRLVSENNNGGVTLTLGRIFLKVFYSMKEQTLYTVPDGPSEGANAP